MNYTNKVTNKDSTKKVKNSALIQINAKKTLNYFKELADIHDLRGEEDKKSLLSEKYKKIFINKNSILSNYLKRDLASNVNVNLKEPLIFPFGFNLSQKEAVEKAFANKLSIIEGPPGTGKTQTILNIIANIIISEKTVAIASSNNLATSNVLEKLEKYELDFLAAFLGKKEITETFIKNQKNIPDLSLYKLEKEEKEKLKEKIKNIFENLQKSLEDKNYLAQLKQQLESIRLERKYFIDDYGKKFEGAKEIKSWKKLSSENFMELWIRYEELLEHKKQFNLWREIINYLKLGIKNKAIYGYQEDEFIFLCQKNFYDTVIKEVENRIDELNLKLINISFEKQLEEYRKLSMKYFKSILFDVFSNRKRNFFTNNFKDKNSLWRSSREVLQNYSVILSTTFSLSTIFAEAPLYDFLILDEASQIDLITGALALSCAKNAVIVGDLKQLPNVVKSELKTKSNLIFSKTGLPECYRYSDHSLLKSLKEAFPEITPTLLREHYRCHPKIIEFCNKKFYNGELIILSNIKNNENDESPLIVRKTVAGNHSRYRVSAENKHVNLREIEEIEQIISEEKWNPDDVGITTPYRNQANELQGKSELEKILSDTVDKYQGREKEIILLTTVDNNISKFVSTSSRINVAVSRAVKKFVLVVNGNGEEKRNNNISDLINYVEYNNFEISEGKVYSIFDYLFKINNEKRGKYLKHKEKISNFDSENLMFNLILEVLNDDKFSKYAVRKQYPLKILLRNIEGNEELSDREKKYAQHGNTKIDFLIWDNLHNSPVLAIEVDGITYHDKNMEQAKKDKMKDHILDVYGIRLKRFPTNGSKERERLVNFLNEHLETEIFEE